MEHTYIPRAHDELRISSRTHNTEETTKYRRDREQNIRLNQLMRPFNYVTSFRSIRKLVKKIVRE